MGLKKLWKDPVWSAVISAGLIALASYLFGLWPTIWQAMGSVLGLLALPISIPLWLIIVAIPALLLVIPIIIALRPDREPPFTKYTNDNIFDINWAWQWSTPTRYRSQYELKALTPRCPTCHAVLSINDYSGSLVSCINENCNWKWARQRHHSSRISHSTELYTKVHNEIDRRIHAGERGDG